MAGGNRERMAAYFMGMHSKDAEAACHAVNNFETLLKVIELQAEALARYEHQEFKARGGYALRIDHGVQTLHIGDGEILDNGFEARQTGQKVQELLK